MNDRSGGTWICIVCGYVHRGDGPPDACPVCGASSEDFERRPEPEAPEKEKSAAPRTWRCVICGYIHDGPEPPESCPICGASPDDFEPVEAQGGGKQRPAGKTVRAIVVGAGIAGVSAADALREVSATSEITLVSGEDALPYYRLNLSRYLAGEVGEDDLPLHPASWYDDRSIRLLRAKRVRAVSPGDKTVAFEDGEEQTFDALILACGAHAFVPPIRGTGAANVSVLRTLDDARLLLAAVGPGAQCVCIGGGILGLEAAGALARRGGDVTILEGFDWLLPRQLNRAAGERLERRVADLGIALRRRANVVELREDARVRGVVLDDGTELSADLVVIATGVRPNTHLARSAGLEVHQGVVVDSRMATSHPDVYAAGDVAEHRGTVYGLWEPARAQGSVAGRNAAGVDAEFAGLPRANALKVLGVDLFSVGEVTPSDGSYHELEGDSDEAFYRFLLRDHRLVGAIFVGDTKPAAAAMEAVKSGRDFSGALGRRPTVQDVLDLLRG